MHLSQGNCAKAMALYQVVLRAREAQCTHEHPSVADTLKNVAVVYKSIQHSKAFETYEEALVIRRAA